MATKKMNDEVRRANRLVDWLIEDSMRLRRQERRRGAGGKSRASRATPKRDRA